MDQTIDRATADLAEVRARLERDGVRYVFGTYVDMHGVPKGKCVPISHLEDMAAGSERYTVGALEGMGELGPHEDECFLVPDFNALTVLPWDTRFAVAPGDLRFRDGSYSHDSRNILKVQIERAAELGFGANAGVEPELYVLRETENGYEGWAREDTLNAPTRAYDIEGTMTADAFLEPMVQYMDELGWGVYSFDHEGGDSQYEFDFRYTDVLAMADRMLIFRLMAKHVARTLGCFATFMPKPFSDSFGSGAHVNMSLYDLETGENVFSPGSGEQSSYTRAAYHFTGGLLRHSGAITALACSTVNSYKRLLPVGLMKEISWAPVFSAYGDNNRTLMCRLPMTRPCIEVRTADSAANFYLVMAMMLAAGLEGIRQEIDPGEPTNADTYKMTDAELEQAGIHRLPRNLSEAVDALERDELARDVLGADFHATFIRCKRDEWLTYNTVVGDWERKQYMHLW